MPERSMHWRQAHKAIMRHNQNRLKRGREWAKLKMPSPEKLSKKAQQMALRMMRKKTAGKRGSGYKKLTPDQKISVDKLVSRVPSAKLKELAKRLLPKARRAAAERRSRMKHQPVVDPKNHPDRTIKNESAALRRLQYAKAHNQRTKHRRHNTADRAKNTKEGGNAKSKSRAKSSQITKTTAGQWTKSFAKDKTAMTKATEKAMMKKFRGRNRKADPGKRMDANWQKVARSSARMSPTSNKYFDQLKNMNLKQDFEEIGNILLEDVVQDRIEQLFIRGLVPKHKIQRYKRILHDPKRYLKLRQYHIEFIDLFRKLQEFVADEDIIYHKVKARVMAQDRGRS